VSVLFFLFFFFQAEDGIRDFHVTGVQTCALPILSTVADADLSVQIVTVSVVAILATIGVYGLVALIVRMDDFGLKLVEKSNNTGLVAKTGNVLIKLLPVVIKALGVIGTVALLLVSGEIFSHQ